jgi:hypothetical protein
MHGQYLRLFANQPDRSFMFEQVLQQATGDESTYDPTIYKGMNNYKDYRAGFRGEHTISSEKGGGAHGPMRANTTIRGTFIMDYKPDLCKDYKETGYCGYGDACKFMHDRGDYKSGWELDKVRLLFNLAIAWLLSDSRVCSPDTCTCVLGDRTVGVGGERESQKAAGSFEDAWRGRGTLHHVTLEVSSR